MPTSWGTVSGSTCGTTFMPVNGCWRPQPARRSQNSSTPHPPRSTATARPAIKSGRQTGTVSPYGMTKLAVERLCQVYELHTGTPMVDLRMFTAYGLRQRPTWPSAGSCVPCSVESQWCCTTGGRSRRELTYIDDAVNAITRAALNVSRGMVVNVGGHRHLSRPRVGPDVVGVPAGGSPGGRDQVAGGFDTRLTKRQRE